MPPDIRSFFTPKGGAPAKPLPKPKPSEDAPKARRTKNRRVLDDSDDDIEEVKPPKASTPKKPKTKKQDDVSGVEMSASAYFSSSRPARSNKSAPAPKSIAEKEVPVRSSPRNSKTTAPKPEESPAPKRPAAARKQATSYAKHDGDDDDDFVDDGDEDGDDIFAADIKGRSKRRTDEYLEDESEEEVLPKAKRVASRGQNSVQKDSPRRKEPTATKKRKSPESEDEAEVEKAPRKRSAPAKPRAPKTTPKSAQTEEAPEIQSILDSIPTVRPPTPPPKDPNAKFDWRKAAAGGGSSAAPPMAGTQDIPEGADGCLTGLTFVFTGLLKTIGREEAQALVKKYEGKVTGQPSSKTSYVVLGDDAGPSKLAKIKAHGIKTIDEAGLFELIRRLPAYGGSGKGAEKAREKKEAEEEKIRAEAKAMESEEKARQAAAEKAAKASAAARGVAPVAVSQPSAQLWTTKYSPTQLSQICGNKSNVEKIQGWLRNWAKSHKYDFQRRGADGMGVYRAIMISGPPGIGKTTSAHLATKLEGFDVIESNASDTRSKRLVEEGLGDMTNNTSLLGFFAGDGKRVDEGKKKIVLIMDEVDGMSAGDRGGVGALAKFCKKTDVPLILICNERRLPKMKPFDFVTFDIKFQRPTVDQIRSRIMTICHREGLKLPPPAITALIEGSNRDIRQIINMIATIKLDQKAMDYDQSKSMSKSWEKHVVLKPWDICQKMLGGGLFSPGSSATLNDKIELYFNDHEFSFLMIQENYLRTKPALLNGKGYNRREENLKHLELMEMASESISDGDLVDRMIHGPQQHWSLMPTHAVFSTVRPASFAAGMLMGSNFTSWLGNNSKSGKLYRLLREVHSHMRLKSSGDHDEVRQQYLPLLWSRVVKRLADEGKDAIDAVIETMDSYYLTREDVDAIKELCLGPMDESLVNIETQAKAAFTRTYNSMHHPLPFMKTSGSLGTAPKLPKEAPDLEEAIEEEDDGAVLDPNEGKADDENDIKGDKYIKQPKAKPKKATKKAAKEDEDEEVKAPTKSKAKGSANKGRGKK